MSQTGLSFSEAYAAALLARAASNGPHFTDPWDFIKSTYLPTDIVTYNISGTAANSGDASGLSVLTGDGGVLVDSNWTANTYKTLLSVTGRGLVSNLIGPTSLVGTPITTWEITVDGVLTEIPVTVDATTKRAVLGPLIPDSTAGAFYTTAKTFNWAAIATDANISVLHTHGGDRGLVPVWAFMMIQGMPCLVFRKSLLIRAKTTESNSTTTNGERMAWVKYFNRTSS